MEITAFTSDWYVRHANGALSVIRRDRNARARAGGRRAGGTLPG
ncbi:hypothetical protein ACTOB_003193 [Actinoplanes oblitus]|uniref:Uncharacterized protein n=1 Tax=Actinoplanes oblitus TaxID=3040509 RepID=A0ABY8WNW1_9ACTN|nr:hypothetical protein [Actinoplanes oblitus]WIM99535.1 hypothetical protein ACTOB_003193 [Actinoplanes oblitus]